MSRVVELLWGWALCLDCEKGGIWYDQVRSTRVECEQGAILDNAFRFVLPGEHSDICGDPDTRYGFVAEGFDRRSVVRSCMRIEMTTQGS